MVDSSGEDEVALGTSTLLLDDWSPGGPDPYLLLALVGSWLALMVCLYCAQLLRSLPPLLLCSAISFLGLRDVCYFVFTLARRGRPRVSAGCGDMPLPAAAVLYPTCNDLCEEAVQSCVGLNYPRFHVYILDDSSDPEYRRKVDMIGQRYPGRVTVVRRSTKKGYKAGNLNHALAGPASAEEVFAIVDADEILPGDFLSRTVPLLLHWPRCGFVQANHRVKYWNTNRFQRELGPGVDIHWRWYQPVRNRHGFVMLLGHGAVIRRSCWEQIGGFPEIVSEDLAFAVAARRLGWRGYFAEGVVCHEEFPRSLRAFRVRHMKWVRGNCEFLLRFGRKLVGSREISVAEKVDILVPMLGANLFVPMIALAVGWSLLSGSTFGVQSVLTEVERSWHGGGASILVLCTLVGFCGPVLCLFAEQWRRPGVLLKNLALSTLAYGGIGALTAVGVVGYCATRQARFLVTGAERSSEPTHDRSLGEGLVGWLRSTHPDSCATLIAELAIGVCLLVAGFRLGGAILVALGSSIVLQGLLQGLEWRRKAWGVVVYLPFAVLFFGVAVTLWSVVSPGLLG